MSISVYWKSISCLWLSISVTGAAGGVSARLLWLLTLALLRRSNQGIRIVGCGVQLSWSHLTCHLSLWMCGAPHSSHIVAVPVLSLSVVTCPGQLEHGVTTELTVYWYSVCTTADAKSSLCHRHQRFIAGGMGNFSLATISPNFVIKDLSTNRHRVKSIYWLTFSDCVWETLRMH